MRDFIYIDQLGQDFKDILHRKNAFSTKAWEDGLWGLSPDYKAFLDAVDINFDKDKNILTFEYNGKVISFQVIYNKNYVFKIRYFKSGNKLYTNDFDDLYKLLTKNRKEKYVMDDYIYNTIFKSVFKKLYGITFDDLYVIERSYLKNFL